MLGGWGVPSHHSESRMPEPHEFHPTHLGEDGVVTKCQLVLSFGQNASLSVSWVSMIWAFVSRDCVSERYQETKRVLEYVKWSLQLANSPVERGQELGHDIRAEQPSGPHSELWEDLFARGWQKFSQVTSTGVSLKLAVMRARRNGKNHPKCTPPKPIHMGVSYAWAKQHHPDGSQNAEERSWPERVWVPGDPLLSWFMSLMWVEVPRCRIMIVHWLSPFSWGRASLLSSKYAWW